MKFPPKIGLVLLLSAAAAVGIYKVGSSRVSKQKMTNISSENTSAVKLSSFSSAVNPLINPASSQTISPADNFVKEQTKNNLTQSFGEILFEQIKAANLLEQQDGATPDLESISKELVGRLTTNNLSEISWITEVDESRVKTSSDNSRNAKENYLKALSLLNQKNFDGFEKNYLEVMVDVYQKINTDSANQLADIYQKAVKDYFETVAPSDWKDLHKKLIIYGQNAEMVYRTMAQYPTDPFKGYLALEALESLNVSGEELQNIFQKAAEKIGL